MYSRSATGYSTFQKLHPLSLLAQLISREVSGHFKLSTGNVSWSLYLTQGRLNFGTNTENPFGRLDRHLQRLSTDIPTLVNSVRTDVRMLFEQTDELDVSSPKVSPDYRAICWLVEENHLEPEQAAALIEAIAVDVVEPFLGVKEGYYELIEQDGLADYRKFCELNLRLIVEDCQKRRRDRLTESSQTAPLSTVSTPRSAPSTAPSIASSETAASTTVRSHPQPLSTNGASNATAFKPTTEMPAAAPTARSFSPKPPSYASPAAFRQTPAAQPPTVQSSEASEKARFTIACIDDSPTVLNAIRSFLNDQSLTIVTINDPVKALMQIMRSKPDLILLDITMPNLDGYELCSLLRRHPYFKNTPIVMVTGNTGLIDRAKAKLVRASGYLTKPFSQSDLLKMVFMHLPLDN
ncbi:MAG: response regulator [Cyanobacteria bacterium P01_A01_bin.114]